MSLRFEEGDEITQIVLKDGKCYTSGHEFTKSIIVIMEYGYMSLVPWFLVTSVEEAVLKINAAAVAYVFPVPKTNS